ncbi:MAG: RusA family crossover junction endodeoxyribonuclease [Methanomicrobia archaeon]|nr:RusA family crossover junction endodeoxyribonuclease [Methanomicrobia archaeon]
MKKSYFFTIQGKAVSKQRPRRGRYGNFYTPSETQDYETFVHTYALKSGLKPFKKKDTIGIEIYFYGQYGRSDIDNLLKATLDGLKFFFNDNKVISLIAKKILSKDYFTTVRIWVEKES